MTDQLLKSLHVAVTRPVDQAENLCEMIRQHGGFATKYPLLAIAPLQDYSTFDLAISTFAHADWAIFISTNAVDNAMPRVIKHFDSVPESVNFAAIGHQTAKALAHYGVRHVLTPHTRFDSETLLALAEMQDVAHKTVVIFRGVGGRELMADTLKARGAHVIFAESYLRVNPQTNTQILNQLWQHGKLDAIVVTSSEAMRNLLALAAKSEWLRHVTLCVNHARVAELPLQYGLKVCISDAPGDDGLINSLSKLVK
ncbi:MAG: uroporphyrinogen-III synthase [Methylophilaceae bacterium]